MRSILAPARDTSPVTTRPARPDYARAMSNPVSVASFYRIRWGAVDEFIELFTRNHWPVLREQLASGRLLDVRMRIPRWHGDGAAGWQVMVTITYRDWPAMAEHSSPEIARRLFPDQDRHAAEERRRFELLEAHWDVVLDERPLPDAQAR
jgi:hypothetical protein